MRITIVCDVLGEENNGTTLAAMNLIRSLKAKGHTLTILCPGARKNPRNIRAAMSSSPQAGIPRRRTRPC